MTPPRDPLERHLALLVLVLVVWMFIVGAAAAYLREQGRWHRQARVIAGVEVRR